MNEANFNEHEEKTNVIDVDATATDIDMNTSPKFSPELVFDGIDPYANAIIQARMKLEELTNGGIMTPDVANRILSEYQYSFFNQFVKISLKK